jgi:hypothetical protein
MTRRSTRLIAAAPILFICCLSAPLHGQSVQQDTAGGRKAGTYFVAGIAHWQGNIFSRSSLTDWNLDLFGADYNLTSINLNVESYFRKAFLISGVSLGYRKDVIWRIDSGHMFSVSVLRDIDCKLFALKVAGGGEWGIPSLNFDQTKFDVADDGTIRYRHTYPARNADIPFVHTARDGVLYPFVELSAVQRPGIFLLEAGVRLNFMPFNFDDYEITAQDVVQSSFQQRNILVPYLFVNLGFRMF